MSPYSRRRVLAGVTGLVVLSGCSLNESERGESASPPPAETAVPSSPRSATDSGTERPSQTSTPAFDDLTVETDETWCPADYHWDPYYHRTPMPPPGRPSNLTRETAIEYVRSYEAYVLTYLAAAEYGPQTPSTATPTNQPEVLEFPDTELRDSSTTALTSLEDGFVVQVTYTRFVGRESEGAYTVNYYVSSRQTIRAEAEGDVSRGPNPTKSGSILEC